MSRKTGTGPRKHFHRTADSKIGCWIAEFSKDGKMLEEPEVHPATWWEVFSPHGRELVRTAYCDEHMEEPTKDPHGNTRAIKIKQ